jgi:hypothetical protein
MRATISSSFRGASGTSELRCQLHIGESIAQRDVDSGPASSMRPGMTVRECLGNCILHCSNICVHHPANRQWPFGRHLCKGSQEP